MIRFPFKTDWLRISTNPRMLDDLCLAGTLAECKLRIIVGGSQVDHELYFVALVGFVDGLGESRPDLEARVILDQHILVTTE